MVSSSLTGLSVWLGFHNITVHGINSLVLQINSPNTISGLCEHFTLPSFVFHVVYLYLIVCLSGY